MSSCAIANPRANIYEICINSQNILFITANDYIKAKK